ncbi:hypothetical protein BJ973_005814 [Actinoplanes tereljensis]
MPDRSASQRRRPGRGRRPRLARRVDRRSRTRGPLNGRGRHRARRSLSRCRANWPLRRVGRRLGARWPLNRRGRRRAKRSLRRRRWANRPVRRVGHRPRRRRHLTRRGRCRWARRCRSRRGRWAVDRDGSRRRRPGCAGRVATGQLRQGFSRGTLGLDPRGSSQLDPRGGAELDPRWRRLLRRVGCRAEVDVVRPAGDDVRPVQRFADLGEVTEGRVVPRSGPGTRGPGTALFGGGGLVAYPKGRRGHDRPQPFRYDVVLSHARHVRDFADPAPTALWITPNCG